jgi:ParB/RepB/Spo0J family partition protein
MDDRERADSNPDLFDLIGDAAKSLVEPSAPSAKPKKKSRKRSRKLTVIDLDRIDIDADSRPIDEDYAIELAESIRERSLNYPILVRPIDGDRFAILPFEGGHRYRAHVILGATKIPCIVDDGALPNAACAIPSRPLTAHDQLHAVAKRRKKYPDESAEEIASATRVSKTNVQRAIDILDFTHHSLWAKLEETPTQDMMSRLHAASNVGRELAELHRRDLQLAWWAREGWIVKRKRSGRPQQRERVRRKIATLDPKETYLGSRVQLWLARAIGDPDVETSIRLAKPPRKQTRRRTVRMLALDSLSSAAE